MAYSKANLKSSGDKASLSNLTYGMKIMYSAFENMGETVAVTYFTQGI
jgi:hypothetical protein